MRRLAALILLSLPPVLAPAQELVYDFVEGSIVQSELDGVEPFHVEGEGLALRFSKAILPRYHVFGAYQDEGFDLELDRTLLELGAGYRYPLGERLDLVGRLSHLESDVERAGLDLGTDGYAVEAGLRGRFTPRVEFDAGARYVDLESTDTLLFFNGRFSLQPNLAVGGGLASGDGGLRLRADIRFLFSR